MATVRDVAEAAGFSLQTVSNVIHQKSYVKAETKQRVEQAIAQLRYQPSRVVQGMRRQSSRALGLIVADPNPRGLADPFYGEVMAGMVEEAPLPKSPPSYRSRQIRRTFVQNGGLSACHAQ